MYFHSRITPLSAERTFSLSNYVCTLQSLRPSLAHGQRAIECECVGHPIWEAAPSIFGALLEAARTRDEASLRRPTLHSSTSLPSPEHSECVRRRHRQSIQLYHGAVTTAPRTTACTDTSSRLLTGPARVRAWRCLSFPRGRLLQLAQGRTNRAYVLGQFLFIPARAHFVVAVVFSRSRPMNVRGCSIQRHNPSPLAQGYGKDNGDRPSGPHNES